RRSKAVCVRNGPVGEDATSAAAGNGKLLLVHVTAFQKFIHADHEVAVVVARIVILNDISKILAVAGRTARVNVENYVTLRGHPLEFMVEDPTVGRVRTAVNIEDHRVLL